MGRYFDSRWEQASINRGIADQQEQTGIVVQWWFWDTKASRISSIYDEDISGASRHWRGPYLIPVFQATRTEGTLQDTGNGAYTVDNVTLVLGYQQSIEAGLTPPVDRTDAHLKDRFVWDGRVWNPSSIVARNLLGGGGTRSTVIIQATQVRDDEMVNDAQFVKYTKTHFVEPDPGLVV